MGRIEALQEMVTSIEQQTALAESMAKGLGENLTDVIRTIAGM